VKFHCEAFRQMSTAILPDQHVLCSLHSYCERRVVCKLTLRSLKFISIIQDKKSISTSQYAPYPACKDQTINAVREKSQFLFILYYTHREFCNVKAGGKYSHHCPLKA
jgi:hypothetical protein